MAEQRYGNSIAMNPGELDAFLGAERTCRVGTVADGVPHVTPLWFVWHESSIWLYSLNRSKRWKDIQRVPTVSLLVDAGYEFVELRGVEILGDAEVIGEVPRVGESVAELAPVEAAFARKYFDADALPHDKRHGWLKITPDTLRSWDFRKRFAS
jgi:hypothetical protein